jgi:phosphoadenosine phosphosulfate reductase
MALTESVEMSDKTAEFFKRHSKVVLYLSAGKDSASCLWLLEPYWDRMTVMWANPGNPYPETVAYMEWIAGMVPNFVEVRGNQPDWVKKFGHPVDILPVLDSPVMPIPGNEKNPKLQPVYNCCFDNFWKPAMDWVEANGFTGVIRGQKVCDSLRTTLLSGQWDNGKEFYHPIEDWDNERVMRYLGDRVPDSYKRGLKSSLDCMNCTAYVKESPGRISDLALIDPSAAQEVRRIHAYVREKAMDAIQAMEGPVPYVPETLGLQRAIETAQQNLLKERGTGSWH